MPVQGTHFYVTLSPRGRLTRWGQFDPKHPKLDTEVLVTEFAKFAAKQKAGHQRLQDGEDFWVGEAPDLMTAVKLATDAAEAFDQKSIPS